MEEERQRQGVPEASSSNVPPSVPQTEDEMLAQALRMSLNDGVLYFT